ncbi:hypothetical protein MMC17_007844 [Xylographa soralifera]|nr:hypothetical protein [Xylographa soralifera]
MKKLTTKKRPAQDLPQTHDSSPKLAQKRRKTKVLLVPDEVPRFTPGPQEPRLSASEPVAETANITTSEYAVGPDILSPSLRHLQSHYAFATMSISSSSKITQKVRSLRSHLEKFSFADLKAKPGVVALYAKANMASKMISVVEIVKREVEREGGRLYQYSRLESLLEQLKEKKPKTEKGGKNPAVNGKTLQEWQAAQDGSVEVPLQSATNDVEMEEQDKAEEEEAFETMTEKGPIDQAQMPNSEERKKVRAIPTMTIYLSGVPVPDFKQLYGEQAVA